MKIASTIVIASIAIATSEGMRYPYFPVFEKNYDFVGNGIDIGSAPASSVNECDLKCADFAGNKCKAYSWSNYSNGTCWLKSSKGNAVYKPGVISSGLYDKQQQVCQLGQNLDVVGFDLASQPAKDPKECCGICQKLDKCRVYSWNKYNGGTCWLKTGHGPIVFTDGVQSASIFPDDAFVGQYYADKDFVGHDIANKPGKIADCSGLCNGVAGCRAYSWSNERGGTCWLKAMKDKVIDKVGVSSGVIAKDLVVPIEKKNDTDYLDNDFQNVAGIAVAEDCVQICADTPDCGAVTWSNYRGGTCWLKHMKGNEKAVAGVKAFALK